MTLPLPELIRKKRDGGVLGGDDIDAFIAGCVDGRVPDYQAAALLMAVYFRGLDDQELSRWTQAMLHSGDVLDLSELPGVKVDKHSTGGVGDMVSLALAPLCAACGVVVPMISGRGLGHTGGTLDKLEAIPGFRTDLTEARFRAVLGEVGACLIGQSDRLAPADRRLYALRDVTGTVESIPLIASSIMSKKLAEGIDALVLDVKVGSGAFMKTLERARALAGTLCAIGRGAGKRVTALLTDMDQPLGRFVGNALEVREAIHTLRGTGSPDVRALTLALGGEMVMLAGRADSPAAARALLEEAIASGAALERLAKLVVAQGGAAAAVLEEALPEAPGRAEVKSAAAGTVVALDAEAIGLAALSLGAGRVRKEDAIDPAVGVELLCKRGDPVAGGQVLALLHHRDGRGLSDAVRRIGGAYRLDAHGAAVGPRWPTAVGPVIEVMR